MVSGPFHVILFTTTYTSCKQGISKVYLAQLYWAVANTKSKFATTRTTTRQSTWRLLFAACLQTGDAWSYATTFWLLDLPCLCIYKFLAHRLPESPLARQLIMLRKLPYKSARTTNEQTRPDSAAIFTHFAFNREVYGCLLLSAALFFISS